METEDGSDDPARAAAARRNADAPPSIGRTLLPSSLAKAVSLATHSTSFALRVGTTIGGYGLGAAKFTTLSSLYVGRGMLEGILSAAGRDVIGSSRSQHGRDNAESVLERSLESLHNTMTYVVFWTTTGFSFTGAIMSKASEYSQLVLSVLDQFFGSTDSSKAIASIITLIRREFENPATGAPGERVGVTDLMLGLCGLAYVQNYSRKLIQEEDIRLGNEEIIWDVVVLNDGERVDVHQDSLYGVHKGNYHDSRQLDRDGIIQAIQRHGANEKDLDVDLPENILKRQIEESLPIGAKVSIATATSTTKTITLEIQGASEMPLLAPPGADMIEREIIAPDASDYAVDDGTPTYRVVYRLIQNKHRSTTMEKLDDPDGDERVAVIEDIEQNPTEAHLVSSSPEGSPPALPPKPAESGFQEDDRSRSNQDDPQDDADGSAKKAAHGSQSQMPRSGVTSPKFQRTKLSPEPSANQKKARQPLAEPRRSNTPVASTSAFKPASQKGKASDVTSPKVPEKKGGLRNALRKGSSAALTNLLTKDTSLETAGSVNKLKTGSKPPWGSNKTPHGKAVVNQARTSVPERTSSRTTARDAPRPAQRGNPNFFSSRDLGSFDGNGLERSLSRSSFVAIHETRRDSMVSQTDTFSIHSYGSRPSSPTIYRSGSISKSKSGSNMLDLAPPSPNRHHQRAKSHLGSLYSPSIYTLKTTGSQTSLLLSPQRQKSAFTDSEAVDALRQTGKVQGTFPDFHILRNISRYSRYASAAYGSNFLRYMGIAKEMPTAKVTEKIHHDVRSFEHHTELPPDSVLLHSFVDPEGGSDSTGSTETGVPLVHTIALDQQSKAVVLSCRGTLGFEDVLADMMCEYDDLVWRGKAYKVHKGIHSSARRLLYGGDGRVLATLKEALEEFPDYGLVMCGHSLGGAVTALLGAMLAEPGASGTAFVTSTRSHPRLLTDGQDDSAGMSHVELPPGRRIHVYAYGPPATMSPALQQATRGLITSTVHGNDVVPCLSLGTLHDHQAIALAFKNDNNEAKAEVRRRVWEGLQAGLASKWYNNAPASSSDEETRWAYAALKTLRASMMSSKLYPPGEVFVIESTPVLRRDAFLAPTEQVGRPATRIVLKYIRNVENRFREIRFGGSMLLDHMPGRYEDALRRLTLGVVA